MAARRRRLTLPATLRQQLVLQEFVLRAFGGRPVRHLMNEISRVTEADGSPDPDVRASVFPEHALRRIPNLLAYDRNIQQHEHRLRLTSEYGRGLKAHQYLALLFTEYYLDCFFADPTALLTGLNKFLKQEYRRFPPYTPSDLETLAFQSATGSGKTLLMHVHIEQYRHYAQRAGRRVRSVILLTPNERMSEQHLWEFRSSRLRARLFTPDTPPDLFHPVEIFDVNKLAEKKGVKRIAVSEFGDDNLVLVDEGHLGASGAAWRKRRAELGRGGFTFEYSATFDQIVGRDPSLFNAYGKSVLFDYPYRDFHEDGYGKDYSIVNLPKGVQDQNSDAYLLGCLLTFYRQLRIWKDHGEEWRDFHLARPLWAFLGKTVLGTARSKLAETTRSDILLIIDFLGRFLGERKLMETMIGSLLAGQAGLRAESGEDWFATRLESLAGKPPAEIYRDICELLFHGSGKLHVEYILQGGGELHLRSADAPVFGIVNVGDAAGLHQRLTAAESPHLKLERNRIAAPMFADVDRETSTVNIVIGARRFVAGWNSWRVSTMGLMHVGVGEGPEIVQMFGRGVRLKGWNLSLKRHGPAGAPSPGNSKELQELETLHVFGLRANYMDTFRRLMADEGLDFDEATFRLPVTWNFGKVRDLQILRLPPGESFERSSGRVVPLDPKAEGHPVVRRNLYSTLELEASRTPGGGETGEGEAPPQHGSLVSYAPFFDTTRIHERALTRKQQAGWWNLEVEQELVGSLLASDHWYDLSIPPEQLKLRSFADLKRLEELAGDLVLDYFEQSWRQERSRWETTRLESAPLRRDDDNCLREYFVTGRGPDAALVRDLEGLTGEELEGALNKLELQQIFAKPHAYEPLIWTSVTPAEGQRMVTVQPVPLNRDERAVVTRLRSLVEENDPALGGRELFLIRNLSRGKGVSFFDDFSYYPDFIVWLRRDDDQHILFLDPKGLGRYGRREKEKVFLHRRIKEIEEELRKRRGAAKPEIHLHACILSTTSPEQIDAGGFSMAEWREKGVYFLKEENSVRDLITDALR